MNSKNFYDFEILKKALDFAVEQNLNVDNSFISFMGKIFALI